MNLLFVIPDTGDRVRIATGIAYVASATKEAGHNTFGMNLNYFSSINHERILSDSILENDIHVVFIGGTSGDYSGVAKIILLSKQIKNNIIVVIGGYLISTESEIVIKNINADFGIIGPGERTAVELLEVLSCENSKSSYDEIPGLIFLNNNSEIIKTDPRKPQPFDFSRIPDLGLLFEEEIQKYKHIYIVCSIGCPFTCTFCSRPIGTKKYYQRSLDSIFNELDHWLSIYDLKQVGIVDELFFADKNRLFEFCSRIKDYDIEFGFQGRVDMVDEEILKELKDAGCIEISYGLESADNQVLASMKKGITIEQIENALTATRKCCIPIVGNFIFGDVEETFKTANHTLDWWVANLSKYDIHLQMIIPLPGSKLYEYAINKGIIRDKLQFLKDGCPDVNISKMTDDEMLKIKNRIANLLQMTSKPNNVVIENLRSDNTMDLRVECGHCFEIFETFNKNLRVDSRWAYDVCPHCGGNNLLRPTDIYKPFLYKQVLDDMAESFFHGLSKENKKIVVWGAKDRGQLMIASSPSLRKCLVKIVDSTYQTYEDKIFGRFKVENPETLKNFEFDSLIIASTNFKDEIRAIATNDFKLDVEILNL